MVKTSITLFAYFYLFSYFQNGVKTTSLADATYGNQKDSANQPLHAWKIWWRNCVTRHATSVVRLIFCTKINLCLIKKLRYFFFHSFIGCSSCDIQYKFIIQHKKKEKKKRSKNPKGIGATGLTSHARHRPYILTWVKKNKMSTQTFVQKIK